RAPMRSSIACLRCRKSKIKCDNNGGTGPCETCIKVGHLCQYPEAATYVLKRSEPGKNVDRDSPHERKRIRKIDETSDNHRAATYSSEVLSYPFLTNEIWDQLFDIYKLHFASELPFLHLPTLKERMRHGTGAHATSPGLNFVLLGVLTLTARFHIDLVKYVAHLRQRSAQTKPDPFAASEFFANALTEALGPIRTTIVAPTVERAQAYLMLGLHEWRQSRSNNGLGAWMYAGIAVRLALSLRLNLGDGRYAGSEQASPNLHAGDKGPPGAAIDVGIAREIKRRTMFSCLVMDRMLACGSERPAMIRTEDIEIQLPCTEMAFDLALDVQTGYLRSSLDGRSNPVAEDNVLARFVQLTNIWRGITRYSIEGGRLSEQLALWDQNSRLMQLQRELDAFNDSLPSTFTLSRQNYYRHDNHQAHSIYVSLHMLSSLCQVVLHRENLPLLPLRCRQPEGPLDQSISSTGYAPSGFWNASADRIFGASRDIIDLVDLCRDKLPMSPLTLFAAWSAGMIAIYAHHFPAMD
ncbi:fungal-specific transcription factor domain-containing protein, partial [Stachybotrys elegans]